MIDFKLKLETVKDGRSCIRLFDKLVKEKKENPMEVDGFEVVEPFTEYLMYLDAEQPMEERVINKKAEIIVVVDKSGSMQGTPWTQVQSSLIKMLDITRDVSNCRAITYNQAAEQISLSGIRTKDKDHINSIRSGGSTNFVAVFKELETIFKDKKEDSSIPYYIFLMTDGHDTCNSPAGIVTAKEHLQAEIERFGGEVVFNVLGFSDYHNDDFLESLALIGTSDGSYSFVSPTEGEKALEERLVALVASTSSNIGRLINIEAIGQNVEFLGDWFGEADKEVVLPAKMTKKDNKILISTRKFVRIRNGEEPNMTLRIHEKLIGNSKPQDATILTFEKIELTEKNDADIYILKKLRSAMNLVSARLGEIEKAEEEAGVKTGYELIKNKMTDLKDLDTSNSDIKRLLDNVKGLIKQCDYVFQPGMVSSETERGMRSKGMRSHQTSEMAGQQQNMCRLMKKGSRGMEKRTLMQQRVKQTDYSKYSDSDSD